MSLEKSSSSIDLTERIQEESKTDEADEGNVFGREERVEKKDEVVLITKFERISGPFLLGKLAQTPKRTCTQTIPKTVWHSITSLQP